MPTRKRPLTAAQKKRKRSGKRKGRASNVLGALQKSIGTFLSMAWKRWI